MANAFDRFDTETAPKAKTGNPFDAFDEVAEAPAPEPYGPSRTSNAGRSFPDAASRKRSGGSQPQENYDSFVEATGKSLDNVPERLQQSFGGLVQMLGEDMGQERERFMQQSASRLVLRRRNTNCWLGQAMKVWWIQKPRCRTPLSA